MITATFQVARRDVKRLKANILQAKPERANYRFSHISERKNNEVMTFLISKPCYIYICPSHLYGIELKHGTVCRWVKF